MARNDNGEGCCFGEGFSCNIGTTLEMIKWEHSVFALLARKETKSNTAGALQSGWVDLKCWLAVAAGGGACIVRQAQAVKDGAEGQHRHEEHRHMKVA